MEIGSLADWVNGLATFTAVLTTLFFTFYKNHLQKRKSKNNAIRSILKLSDNLFYLIKTENINEKDVQKLQQYKMFNIYLMVMTFTGNEDITNIIDIGENLLFYLSKGNTLLKPESKFKNEYDILYRKLKR